MNQQTLAFDEAKRNIREVRQTLFAIAIENNIVDAVGNQLFEPITEVAGVFISISHLALG
jgi:hypothetical protein